jgi:COMPASS component SWD3
MIISGGWDRTIQLYDLRTGSVIDSIFGPCISGDSLDVFEDLIVAGSNRCKDVVQLFSLNKRQLI